jgi:hypothetical protein
MSEINLADELAELRRLAEVKAEAGTEDSEAKKAYKEQEQKVIDLMDRLGMDSSRPRGVGYTFTVVVDKIKGQIEDRRLYFEWALEREPSLAEFIDGLSDLDNVNVPVRERLHEALMNLSILKLSERQELLNSTARAHKDDEAPLPPGMGFRPVPYVSVTKA